MDKVKFILLKDTESLKYEIKELEVIIKANEELIESYNSRNDSPSLELEERTREIHECLTERKAVLQYIESTLTKLGLPANSIERQVEEISADLVERMHAGRYNTNRLLAMDDITNLSSEKGIKISIEHLEILLKPLRIHFMLLENTKEKKFKDAKDYLAEIE